MINTELLSAATSKVDRHKSQRTVLGGDVAKGNGCGMLLSEVNWANAWKLPRTKAGGHGARSNEETGVTL